MKWTVGFLGVAFLLSPVIAEPGVIHTSREGKPLALPKGDDMFHFVVFGDRTGGPAEGIRVLEQAVEDTNLLDPDLVMTVGDLINGYNEKPQWMEQMREFHSVMNELSMPWFPVAGNHDVYWRGKDASKRPPLEHEAGYEKHFGPLWYWFEHKERGFLVLYTDESGNPDKPKSFNDPEQIQMSEEQLAWLSESLTAMKSLKQVFVFLHHPRWLSRYAESNWDEVHRRLADAGNVRAVFAGHIHRLNYAGFRDGIEYFALATTGGSMPGHMPEIGYVHHLNIVTVREDSMSMAILPVGSAIDPKLYTNERLGQLDVLRGLPLTSAYGPLRLDATGSVNAEVGLRCQNPTSQPIEVILTVEPGQPSWRLMPSHRHLRLAPGEAKTAAFRVRRAEGGFDDGFQPPRLSVDVDYLEQGGGARVSLPSRRHEIPVTLSSALPESVFLEDENRVLALSGKGALRFDSEAIELPAASPFTLETWMYVDGATAGNAVITKTENSEFGFFLPGGRLKFDVRAGDGYQSVQTEAALPERVWVHVAGVYDGSELRLYVDGELVGTKEGVADKRAVNRLPLFVGADTDGRGRATRPFKGRLDEVRLSRVARYRGERFLRTHRHEPDSDTVLLLHFDQALGVFHPDHSARAAHGLQVGEGVHLMATDLPVLDTD